MTDKQDKIYHGLYLQFFGDDVEWKGLAETDPREMDKILKDIELDMGMDDDDFIANIEALDENRTESVYKYLIDNEIIFEQ